MIYKKSALPPGDQGQGICFGLLWAHLGGAREFKGQAPDSGRFLVGFHGGLKMGDSLVGGSNHALW
jgi:hypothetical protein